MHKKDALAALLHSASDLWKVKIIKQHVEEAELLQL